MAFIPKSAGELEQEEQERQQQLQLSGASKAAPSSGAPAAAVPAQPKNTGPTNSSGRFINFQQYFAPNAKAAGGMVNRLANPLDEAGTKVEKDTATTSSGNAAAIAGGVVQGPSSNETIQSFSNPDQPGYTWQEASVTNPTHRPADPGPDQVTRDQARENAGKTYSGPKADAINSGYDALQSAAQKNQEKLGLTKDEAGVQTLLRDSTNSPYSSGASRLDGALTGAAQGDTFTNLRNRFGGLVGKVSDARKSNLDAAGAAVTTSEANAGSWKALGDTFDAVDAASATKAEEAVVQKEAESWITILDDARRKMGWSEQRIAYERGDGSPPTWDEWMQLNPYYLGGIQLNPWPERAFEVMTPAQKRRLLEINMKDPRAALDYLEAMINEKFQTKVHVVGQHG